MSTLEQQKYYDKRFDYKIRVALCNIFAAENGWDELSYEHQRLVEDFLTKRDMSPSCFDSNFFEFKNFFNGICRAHPILEHAAQLERAPLEQAINERFLELAATITNLQRTIVDLQNDVKMLTLKVAGGEKKE